MCLICLLSTWLLCVCKVMFIKLVFCLFVWCWYACELAVSRTLTRRTSCFLCFILDNRWRPVWPWKGECWYFDQFIHLVVAPCSVCYSYNYVTCTGCQIGLPMTARCSIQMQCVMSLAFFFNRIHTQRRWWICPVLNFFWCHSLY